MPVRNSRSLLEIAIYHQKVSNSNHWNIHYTLHRTWKIYDWSEKLVCMYLVKESRFLLPTQKSKKHMLSVKHNFKTAYNYRRKILDFVWQWCRLILIRLTPYFYNQTKMWRLHLPQYYPLLNTSILNRSKIFRIFYFINGLFKSGLKKWKLQLINNGASFVHSL